MINRKILERIRGELIEKMAELRGKVSRTAIRMKGGSDRMADFVDQAAVEYEQTVELVIRVRESDQIREIQTTLLRIDLRGLRPVRPADIGKAASAGAAEPPLHGLQA